MQPLFANVIEVVLDPLMDALEWIGRLLIDLAEAIGRWLLWGLVTLVNLLIAGIGAVVQGLFDLLPSLPAQPGVPAVVQYVNWVVPVGPLVAVFGAMLLLYAIFLAVGVIARWVKAW